MSSTQNSLPLNDLLYSFSIDERGVNADLLDEYIRLYPQHARALTEFAIDVVVDSLLVAPVRETAAETCAEPDRRSPSVSRAMSRFQSLLYSLRQSRSSEQSASDNAIVPNPFASLSQKEFRAVAKSLQANNVFVAKLRDRLIELQTMSDGFIQRVSELLRTTKEMLIAHFRGPIVLELGMQQLKAEKKPVVGPRQSFAEAIQSSGLTQDQAKYLQSL